MIFLLVVHVLLLIIYDVGRSEAGEYFSDLSALVANIRTGLDDRNKRMVKLMKDFDLPTPAFMALLSQEPLTVSPGQKIVFSDVRLNVNGYYNARTGVFKAPTSGTYHFALTLSNIDSKHAAFYADIVAAEGHRNVYSISYDGDRVIMSKTISTLVALSAGENVWVKSGMFNMTFAPGKYSFFTGFRVQKL